MAWLDLHEDRTFQFIRNMAMSYAPEGVWACENGVLTLTVSEEETCRFTLEEGGEALRFEAGMGAEEGHGLPLQRRRSGHAGRGRP